MSNTIQNIPIEKIIKNHFQQEGVRDIAKIAEIVSSLKQNENNGTKGLLQVPTARLNDDGMYELAFGHHRFYAFLHLVNTLGDLFFSEIPLIVRELTDIEMFELMAIENFHRRNIGPMEEANTLSSYMTHFKKTSAEAAKKFEKTEEYVRGAIRLLNLPEPARKMLEDGTLNKSAARDLLVAEKIGGASLVQEIVDEIMSDGEKANASETIDDTLRMSNQTAFLEASAGWYSRKKFPVKHLSGLSHADLAETLTFEESFKGDQLDVIKQMFVLISAGMEVTDEAFSMIAPDGLARVRVRVNPPQCEKCQFHAVLNGTHLCGMPQCKKAKVEAWKKKEQEDEFKKIGIPMYQNSDGAFVQLDANEDADQKLFAAGGADLRLRPAQYMWNNFDGIGNNFKVVVIGEVAAKRLKKAESEDKRLETNSQKEAKIRQLREIKEAFLMRFEWEVVSLAFAPMLDGLTNMAFLQWIRSDVIDAWAESEDLPDGVDEDTLLKDAEKAKKADGLKVMRRLNIFHILEMTYARKCSYRYTVDAKMPVKTYAEEFQRLANEWDVTLPKDFMKQAEAYQAELAAAIKEME
jgi:ParB family chromosome partitioning protein